MPAAKAPDDFPGTPPPAFPSYTSTETDRSAIRSLPSLEGFRIVREIGRGGMGLVYEAVQTSLGRRVAIKELHQGDERLLARFRREAAILARLGDHENLAQVFDILAKRGKHYIVMEFVDGLALSTALDARGRLDLSDALRVAGGVARALEHAHANGVVHRDVKPANVMVNQRGVVKVMDFGIARTDEESRITLTGQTLGTPTYMSPEQADGEQDVDERSDLYSLCVLLYHMACGRPPFRSASALATLRMHLEAPPPPASSFLASIDADLDAILLKGLSKKRGDRFQTAAGFRLELENYARRAGLSRAFDSTPSSGSWLSASSLGISSGSLANAPLAPTTPSVEAIGPSAPVPGFAPRDTPPMAPPGLASTRPPSRLPSSAALFNRLGLAGTASPARAARPSWERKPAPRPVAPEPQAAPPLKPRGKRFAKLAGAVNAIAITPDGQTALTGGADGSLRVWSVRHGTEAARLDADGFPIHAVAASPNGRLALSCGEDGVATLWDLASGRPLRRLDGLSGLLRCCAFSGDGRRAACGGDGKVLHVWDLVAGTSLLAIEGHEGPIAGVAYAPAESGERLLSASEDGMLRVWNAANGELIRAVGVGARAGLMEAQGLSALAISLDGKRALVGGASGVARWIEVESGREARRFDPAQPAAIAALAVSPDATRGLVASVDPRVHVWALETGDVAMRFEGHAAGVACAAFSPSGRWALTGGRDGEVWAWNLA